MATVLENLTSARANIAKQLADLTANPKPTYSLDGVNVSWTDLFNSLMGQYAEIEKALQRAGGPFEKVTQAIS